MLIYPPNPYTDARKLPAAKATQSESMPFTISTTTVDKIPAQKRLGRTSKFNPLFERLKTLGETQALSFPIEKYTQIQGIRNKLGQLGFVITTRSDRDTKGNLSLMAFIYHAPKESS